MISFFRRSIGSREWGLGNKSLYMIECRRCYITDSGMSYTWLVLL